VCDVLGCDGRGRVFLRLKSGRTNVSFDTVLVFAVLPILARIIAENYTALGGSHWGRM
jgi:hypothetical protein